jgi:hypothetical protein
MVMEEKSELDKITEATVKAAQQLLVGCNDTSLTYVTALRMALAMENLVLQNQENCGERRPPPPQGAPRKLW